ncbi:MAG: hypothetical protein ABSB78_04460 [Bacteroidota bacterium]
MSSINGDKRREPFTIDGNRSDRCEFYESKKELSGECLKTSVPEMLAKIVENHLTTLRGGSK